MLEVMARIAQRGPPRRVERPHRRCALVIRHFYKHIYFLKSK
jgi:hypothetical protein